MNLSLLALAAVFLLIAARRIGGIHVPIWAAMAGGALFVLLTGQIAPLAAWNAIDFEVMGFLFGMFLLGHALAESGLLYRAAYELFSRVHSADALVLMVLYAGGLTSALLMNDTIAIVGTPLVLRLAREHGLSPKLLLLALAFGVTLGSVPSPIGNPQNLLIATHGKLAEPFGTFLARLGLPTLLNLALAYGVLRLLFRREFHDIPLVHKPAPLHDADLARLARWSLGLIVLGVSAKIIVAAWGLPYALRLSPIALAGALPLLLFSRKRLELLRHTDWPTLAFFAAMFVLMASVWQSGVFQAYLEETGLRLADPGVAMGLALGVSQLISNVPLVALYLPFIEQAGHPPETLMALAAGSTVAGNLLILGAASNVIIVQNAEKRGATLSFWDFARAGMPLTAINALVYWVFLR